MNTRKHTKLKMFLLGFICATIIAMWQPTSQFLWELAGIKLGHFVAALAIQLILPWALIYGCLYMGIRSWAKKLQENPQP